MSDTLAQPWSPALVVPIQVEALPVTAAAQNAAWSWTSPNYAALRVLDTVDARPFTGQAPVDASGNPFTGVVVHWALPDALSKGAQNATSVSYPPIPNRWLIARRWPDGTTWSTAAWIVASDYLDGELGSQWPNEDGTGGATVGMVWPIDEWPGEDEVAPHALRPAMTAAGPGDASWSAFVPNVINVLAFADPLVDSSGDAIMGPVSYTVAGWYSDPSADPMSGVADFGPPGWTTREEWQSILDGFSWSVGDEQELAGAVLAGRRWATGHGIETDPQDPRSCYPTRLLCSGAVLGVDWQGPNGPYISSVPTTNPNWPTYQQPGVALGNSGLDAFAAMFAQAERAAGMPEGKVQTLIHTLQAFLHEDLDLLDRPDGLTELGVEIRKDWFANAPGGTTWDVVAKHSTTDPGGRSGDAIDAAPGALLSALNRWQHELDDVARDLAAAQGQCYALWWKAAKLAADMPPPPAAWVDLVEAAAPETRAEVLRLANSYRWLRQARDEALLSLTAQLGDLELVAGSRNAFHRPAQPVLLVNGAGRGYKHGPDGRFSPFDVLACRFTGQTVAGILVPVDGDEHRVDERDEPAPPLPDAEQPAEVADLLVESFFLDQLCAPVIAQVAATKAGKTDPWSLLPAIRAEQTLIWNPALHPEVDWQTLAERTGLTFAYEPGVLPSKVAIALWWAPWSPLYLDWQFDYYPGTPRQADALAPWEFCVEPDEPDATLDEYAYRWRGTSPTRGLATGLRGRTFLTPLTSDLLTARITKLQADFAHDPSATDDLWALQSALDYLHRTDLLSQALTGFDELLLQNDPATFAMPVDGSLDAYLEPQDAPSYSPASTPDPTAGTITPSPFNPVRAAHMRLIRLWVVDAFGQVLQIVDPGQPSLPPITPMLDADLVTSTEPGLVELKPRLTQFARLDLSFLASTDDSSVLGVHNGVDPVCGWVIPNHLDRSLLIYSADGILAGELLLAVDRAMWAPAPQTSPPPVGPAPVQIADAHLRRMVSGVVDAADSGAALNELLQLIDTAFWSINPSGGWSDAELPVLIGRPLALVRARLALGLRDGPVYRQDWPVTGQNETDGYGDVGFDVQLGAAELLDDGLVGFYLNDDYRRIRTTYEVTHTADYVTTEPPTLRAADPAGVLLTLLMDPQSSVHAITGMLPALTVTLPASLSTPALNRMALTFRTGPVLGDPGPVAVPLPTLNNGVWSWLQYSGTVDVARRSPVLGASTTAALPDAAAVLREGWLDLLLDGPPTALSYSISPATVSTTTVPANPATATLLFTAYNGTAVDVDCSRIVFSLPVGPAATDFGPTVSTVVAVPLAGTAWQIAGDGAGAFVATPSGSGVVKPGATLGFHLTAVPVGPSPGTVDVDVSEVTDRVRSTRLLVSKVLPRPSTLLTYTAAPATITVDASATIVLTAMNAGNATVYPSRLALVVPLGAAATDLAGSAAVVTVTPPTGWTTSDDGRGVYTLLPVGGAAVIPAGTGLQLTVAVDAASALAGVVLTSVVETAAGQATPSPQRTATASVLITKSSPSHPRRNGALP